MPEAVIVATGRTPIGRANKGSLVECRPDDLSATVVKALLEKVPDLDPTTADDGLLASLLTLSDVYGTGWHAAHRAGVSPGDTVAVIGDGAVGLLAVMAAHQALKVMIRP